MDRRLLTTDRAALSCRALILALHPDRGVFASDVGPRADQVDWAWVLRRARAQKVAALVAARIEECGVGNALDADLRAQVAEVRGNAARRAGEAERSLAYLVDQYGRAGIPFFVMKGSVLSHHVYNDRLLRLFNDIDIVVHRRDVEPAEAILRSQSFRAGGVRELLGSRPQGDAQKRVAQRLTRRFDSRRLAAFSWSEPPSSRLTPGHLHWQIVPYRLRLSEEQLWRQTTTVVVADTPIVTLNSPAMLIHLALHATTCLLNGFRLMHLCDVGWAARRLAGQEEAVWQLAAEWKVQSHLALVFEAAERALGSEQSVAPSNGRHRGALARPWERTVTSQSFLIESTESAQRPVVARAWAELAWSVAMRCVYRNVVVATSAAWARLRWRFYLWRFATKTRRREDSRDPQT